MALLRGVFLTSDDPARTAQFYEQVAQLPIERIGEEGGYQYWKMDHDGMQLAIHVSDAFSGRLPLRDSSDRLSTQAQRLETV